MTTSTLEAGRSNIGQPRATQRAETLRLYAAEWLAFVAWCRAAKRTSLPADADTLAAYLLTATPGASRGTLGRKRAAIRAVHRRHGLPPPTLDSPARAAVRRVAAPLSKQADRALPATQAPTNWVRLAVQCPRDLAGLRDRALLLLAASRQVTSEALLGLEREQVRFTNVGVELRLSQDAPTTIPVARDSAACPARALEDWLQASNTRFGPVFRKVDRWGNIEHTRLGPDGLRRIVARRATARGHRGRNR